MTTVVCRHIIPLPAGKFPLLRGKTSCYGRNAESLIIGPRAHLPFAGTVV